MELQATLEAIEQRIEAMTEVLQQAHDALDDADIEPVDDTVEVLSDASEQLQSLSSQLDDACDAWQAETGQLNNRLADTMSALKAALADLESQSDAESGLAAHAFAEARTEIDRNAAAFLGDAERAVTDAAAALDGLLRDSEGQLSGLLDASQARFVDLAASDIGQAISSLNDALGQLESAGGDVAHAALDGVKTISDGLEDIMGVLQAVKPAFDAISVVS